MASTLEEYQKYSSLGVRISKHVAEWRSLQACAHTWLLKCSSCLWPVQGIDIPKQGGSCCSVSMHTCQPCLCARAQLERGTFKAWSMVGNNV